MAYRQDKTAVDQGLADRGKGLASMRCIYHLVQPPCGKKAYRESLGRQLAVKHWLHTRTNCNAPSHPRLVIFSRLIVLSPDLELVGFAVEGPHAAAVAEVQRVQPAAVDAQLLQLQPP